MCSTIVHDDIKVLLSCGRLAATCSDCSHRIVSATSRDGHIRNTRTTFQGEIMGQKMAEIMQTNTDKGPLQRHYQSTPHHHWPSSSKCFHLAAYPPQHQTTPPPTHGNDLTSSLPSWLEYITRLLSDARAKCFLAGWNTVSTK